MRASIPLVLSIALSCGYAPFGSAQTLLPLQLGAAELHAEYALSYVERARGLMERTELAADRGMLFRFDEVRRNCLWMKNTPLPLSVAFVDDGGRVINVEDMQPHTTDNHCAAGPARFALEMNLGWFAERGIKAGDTLRGFDRLPAPR